MLLAMAVITRQSPDGTAFTLPLYHPVAAPAVDDAISTAKINLPTRNKKLETNSGVNYAMNNAVLLGGSPPQYFRMREFKPKKKKEKRAPVLYASQTQERINMIEMTMGKSNVDIKLIHYDKTMRSRT